MGGAQTAANADGHCAATEKDSKVFQSTSTDAAALKAIDHHFMWKGVKRNLADCTFVMLNLT